MDGLQSVLSSLPTVGVYVVGAATVAALGLTGSSAVAAVAPEGVKSFGKVFGGMIGAAVGGFVAMQLKQKRESAAIIELSNILVEMGDPTGLTREIVAGVEAKYGIELCVSCLEEMKSLYGTFVEAAIPAGAAPLSGSEQVMIQNFKNALGLTDEDAAPVHMDVGRRVLRGRLESSSRGEDFEARKTFQKLIYVSSLVFGERKAAFLLPWSRVFGLTDAQVQVARKDNAIRLFEAKIAATGLKADKSMLASLKEYQAQVRLADEEAVDVIVAAEQKVMEGLLDTAIETVKKRARGKDFGPVLAACKEAVEYNKSMEALKESEGAPSGVGAVSLTGTAWEAVDGRSKDLREVFRYVVWVVCECVVCLSELCTNGSKWTRMMTTSYRGDDKLFPVAFLLRLGSLSLTPSGDQFLHEISDRLLVAFVWPWVQSRCASHGTEDGDPRRRSFTASTFSNICAGYTWRKVCREMASTPTLWHLMPATCASSSAWDQRRPSPSRTA